MIRTFLSILTAFSINLSSGCASGAGISENAIGPISLGLEKSKIAEFGFSFSTRLEEYEGLNYEVYVIEIHSGAEITAEFDSADKIAKLTTSSPFFVTPEGARVGSSLDRLRETYPSGKVFSGFADGLYFHFEGGFNHHIFAFDAVEIGMDCVEGKKKCPEDLGSKPSIRFFMYSTSE